MIFGLKLVNMSDAKPHVVGSWLSNKRRNQKPGNREIFSIGHCRLLEMGAASAAPVPQRRPSDSM